MSKNKSLNKQINKEKKTQKMHDDTRCIILISYCLIYSHLLLGLLNVWDALWSLFCLWGVWWLWLEWSGRLKSLPSKKEKHTHQTWEWNDDKWVWEQHVEIETVRDLSCNDPEWKEVIRLLPTHLVSRPLRISHIINPTLLERFQQRVNKNQDIKTEYLYHGTSLKNCQDIARVGFSAEMVGQSHGTLYGWG